jgi:hypothetical protein
MRRRLDGKNSRLTLAAGCASFPPTHPPWRDAPTGVLPHFSLSDYRHVVCVCTAATVLRAWRTPGTGPAERERQVVASASRKCNGTARNRAETAIRYWEAHFQPSQLRGWRDSIWASSPADPVANGCIVSLHMLQSNTTRKRTCLIGFERLNNRRKALIPQAFFN